MRLFSKKRFIFGAKYILPVLLIGVGIGLSVYITLEHNQIREDIRAKDKGLIQGVEFWPYDESRETIDTRGFEDFQNTYDEQGNNQNLNDVDNQSDSGQDDDGDSNTSGDDDSDNDGSNNDGSNSSGQDNDGNETDTTPSTKTRLVRVQFWQKEFSPQYQMYDGLKVADELTPEGDIRSRNLTTPISVSDTLCDQVAINGGDLYDLPARNTVNFIVQCGSVGSVGSIKYTYGKPLPTEAKNILNILCSSVTCPEELVL